VQVDWLRFVPIGNFLWGGWWRRDRWWWRLCSRWEGVCDFPWRGWWRRDRWWWRLCSRWGSVYDYGPVQLRLWMLLRRCIRCHR